MAKILCRTKGNANPKGKPRVYFTCHPEDFERYFNKICEDIFKTHDCAIFYTEDMKAVIAEEDKSTDLESNNLFVVPVTFRLLSQPNRAMDADIPFAFEKHIPVLPFMMEPGIDEFYSRPDKFGELQYLNPYSTDLTEVSYEEKLKKYLESVLISDEMAKRVRAAFDAYIFLSYRKKDRRYANELMRLIHSHPECRDIAIWYDEFLTPGESFKTNIEKALQNSKLFTLLVTPNLLEEPDGKPNFVMGVEYPEAQKSGIDILPAEMEETDKDALSEKYDGIPQCIDPHDEAFKLRLLESISKIITTANDDDPTHNFLIGLAYLEGIDVEVDRQRGLELITSAAEADLPEAMEKLYNMYKDGAGIRLDYREAAKWAENLVEYYKKLHGEEHAITAKWLHMAASSYRDFGDYQKALTLNNNAYIIRLKVLGKDSPYTLATLSNMALIYDDLGDYYKSLELHEKIYTCLFEILGVEHPVVLSSLSNLACAYGRLGDRQKELALQNKAYELRCKIFGEEHMDTLTSLNNLAQTYGDIGNYQKELELSEKAYVLICKILGEEHPDTITVLNNLALACGHSGDRRKALSLYEKVHTQRCKILGEKHPDTLMALSNLAFSCGDLGDYKKAMELNEKVYTIRCKILGEEHPDTLTSLSNLALGYDSLGDHQKALVLREKVYALRCKTLGEEHPKTLVSMNHLSVTYNDLGDYKKALALDEKIYALCRKILGEEHPDTILALDCLSYSYSQTGDSKKEIELREKVFTLRVKLLGKDHPDTQKALDKLSAARKKQEAQKAGYRAKKVCQHCGGTFAGLFKKKCSKCGKPKDY